VTKIKTSYRTCNLCEAMCGLEIKHQDKKIIIIKGDEKDPFSQGHICPKAIALQDLYEDPDRLLSPMERKEDGWHEISWKSALDKTAKAISSIRKKHGNNALGIYLGNPNVHNLGGSLNIKHLLGALKTHNRFSATSVDQLPHHIVAHHLFGHQLRIPVPDINRCDYMLIIGANPVASNGSIMTVANVRQKIKDIKKREGKVVVVDPRRSETAELASEHHFIKPGSDILMLLAMLNEVFTRQPQSNNHAYGLLDKGDIALIQNAIQKYDAAYAENITGISQATIKQMVTDLMETPRAVIYGRMGVSVQEFGLLSQYLIMVLNILTGHLDTEGGLMFPKAAADIISKTGPGYFAKRKSRVRKLPDFNGEFPAATMADEITTKGEGQIKAMLTVAGNPVLSTPNGGQLDSALSSLEFMVSIDYYLNETTRHANIILPPVSPIERDHYDLSFHGLAVHNTANFSPALFKKPKGQKHDWQIYLELVKRVKKSAPIADKLMRYVTKLIGPNFMLDALLKSGPYENLSLKTLKANPHGVDLGPLESALPGVLNNKDSKINLNPSFYLNDLVRMDRVFESQADMQPQQALLIGRRHVRSNNSWMHNSQRLVKGKSRCTLLIHPEHAQALSIKSGQMVEVSSRVNKVQIEAQLSDEVMNGVVSIPHGFGHNRKGIKLKIAQQNAGVSVNDLTDDLFLDELSGNAAVNGVIVSLVPQADSGTDSKAHEAKKSEPA